MRSIHLWAVLLGLAPFTACAGPLDTAEQAFAEGRYPHAMAALRHREADRLRTGRDEWRRYALCRGLTHLALGDARAANRWLAAVKRDWDTHPEAFSEEQTDRLLVAWRSLGHMPGEPKAKTGQKR
jgi:hypothetical protein